MTVYKQLPGQFRAELQDRFLSPIYPFAFAAAHLRFPRRAAHHAPEPQLLDRRLDLRGVRPAHGRIRLLGVDGENADGRGHPVRADAGRYRHRPLDHRLRVGDRAAASVLETVNKSLARMQRLFGRPATA